MKKTVKLLITIIIFTQVSLASDLKTIRPILEIVETNSNPDAIGDSGKSFGILQIQKVCVDDVNRIYGTKYTHDEMFNPECAKEVFYLYLNAGIERYRNKYNKEPTEKDIVRMWNGGIYKGYRYKQTIKYYNKYLEVKMKYKLL